MKQLVLLVFASILGGAIALGSYQFFVADIAPPAAEQVNYSKFAGNTYQSKVGTSLSNAPTDFTRAAEKGMPGVVHITASKTQTQARRGGNDILDFFGYMMPDIPQEGTGSGVIISRDGYIVTNNHVIDFADKVEVTLFDKRKFTAKVIGTDPTTDIAVIKIEDNNLPTLKVANSDKVKVGEWVLAVGNPFNLTSTVTAGIVSAKGRDINILRDRSAIESFIQTDAAVNPGNSGGALINLEGELIGINTAIQSRTGSFAGYSFAVPSNIAKKVVDDIIQYGSAQRGFLGINIISMSNDLADELNLNFIEGVYVEEVAETGAAIKAGILPGDIVTAVNDQEVKSAPELQELIGRFRPGDTVTLELLRRDKIENISVRLQK